MATTAPAAHAGAASPLPHDWPVAVVITRAGEVPPGGEETVTEAGGYAIVLGEGAEETAGLLRCARRIWWYDTGPGLHPGRLANALAPLLADVQLALLPASPDGRDLAPRLAARLDRPLLAHASRAVLDLRRRLVSADLSRLEGRITVPVEVDAPAVATIAPGEGIVRHLTEPAELIALRSLPVISGEPPADAEVIEVVEPEPETMDLADAQLVFGGGAGLAARLDDATARAVFDLLVRVAGALGASAGATRVATDAGWIGYDRQIGTTGVSVRPRLYVALGVSGASQHVGGLGAPEHVVSVNSDPSSPMTAMADLGLVTDARALLVELARRLDIEVPEELTRE
jgi:electron transfer flavoprotein alpha subunit